MLISRSLQLKCCKCREMKEEFAQSCLRVLSTDLINLGIFGALSCFAVLIVVLFALKKLIENRVAHNAVVRINN